MTFMSNYVLYFVYFSLRRNIMTSDENLQSLDILPPKQRRLSDFKKYTSKENLCHVENKSAAALNNNPQPDSDPRRPSTSRIPWSGSPPTDWSLCLFCKKKTHKKIKKLITVRTFQACDTIVKAANLKRDHELLALTSTVNNDLIAAKAKYHQSCHAS